MFPKRALNSFSDSYVEVVMVVVAVAIVGHL